MTLEQLRPFVGPISLIVGVTTIWGSRAFVAGSRPRLKRIVLGLLIGSIGLLMLLGMAEEEWVWPTLLVLYVALLWKPRAASRSRPGPPDAPTKRRR